MTHGQRLVLVFASLYFLVCPAHATSPAALDPSSVTNVSSDAPESLRKAAGDFGKTVSKIDADANAKRAKVREQILDGLERAITKAQVAGDLDGVLALQDVKKRWDELQESDIPAVKSAIAFRERKFAEIETARLAEAAKSAKEFHDKLETAKRAATRSADFEAAKAFAAHQSKILDWVKSLQSSVQQQNEPSQSVQPLHHQSARTVDEWVDVESAKTVIVDSRNSRGNSIGTAKQGDRFVIRYESGAWNHAIQRAPTESPDAVQLAEDSSGVSANRAVIIRKDNPGRILQVVPAGTKMKSFSFEVPENGEYSIRILDNEPSYRPDWFGDNKGQVRYVVRHQKPRPVRMP